LKNLNGCVGCLSRRSFGAIEKELYPFFPNTFCSDALKEIVITLAARLEIKTRIQKGLAQYAFGAKKERNEQTTKAPISIEKRVNRFELHMYKSSRNEDGKFVFFVVKELFKVVETFHHLVWGRRHECSIARSAATNPIL
jgi:hypothetical protein